MTPHSVLEHADRPLSEREAAALTAEIWGVRGSARRLSGERDQNFRILTDDGAAFLLKLSNSAEPPDVTDLQTKVLLHLEARDPRLPVPRLLRTVEGTVDHRLGLPDGSSMAARLMTFLTGEPAPASELALPDLAALGQVIARLDRALSEFEHPGESPDLLWDLQQAGRLDKFSRHIAPAEKRRVAERALAHFVEAAAGAKPALRRQVIHNDLNPHNVLVVRNPFHVTGLLDFGDAVRAPLIHELAIAASYCFGPDEASTQRVAALAAGYREILALESREVALLPSMILGRLAMTVLITAWRAERYPDNAAYILRNAPSAWAGLESLMDGGLAALEAALTNETAERAQS